MKTHVSSDSGVRHEPHVHAKVSQSRPDALVLLIQHVLHVVPLQGLLQRVRHDEGRKASVRSLITFFQIMSRNLSGFFPEGPENMVLNAE